MDNVEHFLMWIWTLRHAEAFLSFLLPEGCPGFCNNNGRCTLEASGWHCICQPGWRGAGCHVAMETLCTDGKDNEGGMSALVARLNVQTPSPDKARLLPCRTWTSASFLPLACSFCTKRRRGSKLLTESQLVLFQLRSV